MLRSRYRNPSHTSIYKLSSVIQLFERIGRLNIRNEYSYRLKSKSLLLLFLILVFCFFQCPSRVYNAWAGPFHLNLDEFITYWDVYSGNMSIERSFLSGLFSLDKEYIQIELGENKIDDNPEHVYGVYYRHPVYEKLLYTFNPIKEQNISTFPMQLFVKLPTHLQSHFHKRLPYRFELFHDDTLKCIAEQIAISPEVHHSNFEKLKDIRLIEEIYDQNASDFNMKVITKCGILIGYLYDCLTETVFPFSSNLPHKFTALAAAFDASSSYSPYTTYLFGSFLLLWCFKEVFGIFLYLVRLLWHIFRRCELIISSDVQNTLNRFNINSIQLLDYLLMRTREENNYHNQLFLVGEQRLIIFKVNLDEHNPKILSQFCMTPPFIILDTDSIISISSDYISISYGVYGNRIPLPKINDHNNDNTANWLHERLIDCSADYRQRYEQERLRTQEYVTRAQEERRLDRLAALINEEEEILRVSYENDFERIWNRTTSASPRFIAEFRLQGAQIMNRHLSDTTCTICLEILQPGEYYSQWPCPAHHAFHYNCMLNVLRRQNQCPLCRHTVEAANLPPTDVVFNMFLSGVNFPVTN